MNNICVDNLFNYKKSDHEPLTVYTLYNPHKIREKKEVKLSVNELIREQEIKKKKIKKEYRKIYRLSMSKIKLANKMKQNYVMYEVPESVYRCPDYNSLECLIYVQKKLRKLKFSTEIMSDNTLYIDWSFIN